MAETKTYTKQQLERLILNYLQLENMPLIFTNHIKKLTIEHHMSYKQIARLVWYGVEIKKRPLNTTYGLTPYLSYQEESDKYYAEKERDLKEREAKAKEIDNHDTNTIIFKVHKLGKRKRPNPHSVADFKIKEDDDGSNK